MEVTDLTRYPSDILVDILIYIGYTHQQRLVRVCRFWKCLVTTHLEQIYVDATLNFETKRISRSEDGYLAWSREDIPDVTKMYQNPFRDFKYRCKTVRQLIYNGGFTPMGGNLNRMCLAINVLARRFPQLATIFMVNTTILEECRIDYFEPYSSLKSGKRRNPSVRIILRSLRVTVLPVPQERRYFGGEKLASIEASFDYCLISVPDMEFISSEDFGRNVDSAIWPYPFVQTEWLARHASKLNIDENVLPKIAHVINSGGPGFINSPNKFCEDHDKLCEHLDPSFYRDNLDGYARLTLTICLFAYGQRAQIVLEPPPLPFTFLYELWSRPSCLPRQINWSLAPSWFRVSHDPVSAHYWRKNLLRDASASAGLD